MSSVNKEFFESLVGGKVQARFVLDKNNKPACKIGSSLKHYGVEISLPNQNPDVQGVVYKLHPSYYDPVRETIDPANNFQTEITSYGDYDFNVEVQIGSRIVRDSFRLSELLEQTHGQDQNPDIQQALNDIRQN